MRHIPSAFYGFRETFNCSHNRCVAPPDRHFTVTAVCCSENKSKPRAKHRAICRDRTARFPHAQPGPQREVASGPRFEDLVRKACTAEECRVHSACAGSERSQPRRGKVGGRARRRALCARCSRLVWQVSPRAARHARMHEYIMHHTAWTACSTHVLAGRRKAVELTDNGYL